MAILGLRGTGQFTTDFRPTNYRELYTLLEPSGAAPLQALLAMTSGESTDDPKFNHFRDELPNRVLNLGAAATNSATTISLTNHADVPFITAGTMLHSTSTGENMLVTSTAAAGSSLTVVTVTRGIGSTAAAILINKEIVIIGSAQAEGGNSPDAVSFDPTVEYNYTQIFKTPVNVSRTLKNTTLRTGDKEQEQLTKALKMHMGDIERAMFFGKRHILNGSSSTPTRFTGGLFESITNITDAASNATANRITEKEFDRLLVEDLFAYGSTEKIAFCGAGVAANMQEIAKNRWQPTQVDGAYGVNMSRYSTFAGDLNVILHPMFRQIPSLKNSMVVLDLPNVKYRSLANSDTQLERDIQGNDADASKHQYLTECGLELTQAKVHHVVKNWLTVS
jgi:hypothetical protein|tara:strand:- start:4429 stop:5607 length:1179 start_codon:yes stop_codon:yes gene_type:complete